MLQPTAAHDALDPDSPVSFKLPEGTRGHALATSTTLHRSATEDWLGFPMVLVQTPLGTGWVRGGDVAIAQDWDGPGAWEGEPLGPRPLGAVKLWTAGRTGAEWDDQLDDFERPVMDGWLVVERGEDQILLPWALSNGWGTTRGAERVVWRDLTGDGVEDALVVFQETVTEAGNAGRTLELWDFQAEPLVPLLSIPVDDPHWTGLATQEAVGWVDVDLAGQSLTKTAVYTEPCATPGKGPRSQVGSYDAESCLSVARTTWSWGEGEVRPAASSQSSLRAEVTPGPARSGPEAEAPQVGEVSGAVLLRGVRGPIGLGDPFEVELVAAGGGRRASLGWVSSDRLRFDEPMVAEILGPWPEEHVHYVRFDWDRPPLPPP